MEIMIIHVIRPLVHYIITMLLYFFTINAASCCIYCKVRRHIRSHVFI